MRRGGARHYQAEQAHRTVARVSAPTSHFRFAYIEFADKESSVKAKHLNESLFKGRQLTVMPKRKNKPGMGRGGGFGMNPRGNPMAMMMTLMRGMQRGMYRGGRGRGGFRGRGGRGGAGEGGAPS